MPSSGPGSIGGFGRRLIALCIDWAAAQLISVALLGVEWGSGGAYAFVPLGVFALENLLLVSTTGTTLGHRLLGLRVRSVTRPALTPLQVVVRTLLLCLVIPAVIWDRDGRGLHDRAAGTAIVRA